MSKSVVPRPAGLGRRRCRSGSEHASSGIPNYRSPWAAFCCHLELRTGLTSRRCRPIRVRFLAREAAGGLAACQPEGQRGCESRGRHPCAVATPLPRYVEGRCPPASMARERWCTGDLVGREKVCYSRQLGDRRRSLSTAAEVSFVLRFADDESIVDQADQVDLLGR